MISGSVPKSLSRGKEVSSPIPMMISPITPRDIRAVDTVTFISLIFPAPKNWEMTTVHPMESPAATATERKTTGKDEPTAARASSPTNRPTTMESTML